MRRTKYVGQCQADGCERDAATSIYCTKHYLRFRIHGDPLRERPTMEERFWRRVDKTGQCWIWTGVISSSGYGQISAPSNTTKVYTHRYSAMLHFGMFDRRLLVLHHCDNKRCVRPDHLYLGNHSDNLRDRHQRQPTPRKPACIHGHPFDEANTRFDARGWRTCKACARERARSKANV